jgi:hypothetical protein
LSIAIEDKVVEIHSPRKAQRQPDAVSSSSGILLQFSLYFNLQLLKIIHCAKTKFNPFPCSLLPVLFVDLIICRSYFYYFYYYLFINSSAESSHSVSVDDSSDSDGESNVDSFAMPKDKEGIQNCIKELKAKIEKDKKKSTSHSLKRSVENGNTVSATYLRLGYY